MSPISPPRCRKCVRAASNPMRSPAGAARQRRLTSRRRTRLDYPGSTLRSGVRFGLQRARRSTSSASSTQRLSRLAAPATRQRLVDLGDQVVPREEQAPERLRALHEAEIDKWWPIIKAANIKAE